MTSMVDVIEVPEDAER